MKRDQEVTVQVLERICDVLDADFGDIIEYIPDEGTEDVYSPKIYNQESAL